MLQLLDVETRIHLNKFKPREYQLPIYDALENKGYKRIIAVWPRRAGKDIMAFQLAVRACLKRVCTIYYVLPTFSQCRRVVWDNINMSGEHMLEYIPSELIAQKNSSEMKIRFINGSILQLLGSDTYDTSIIGTNPQGIIFSEFALQDPRAYQYSRPILAANGGWAIFLSTPRGSNHLFELYELAKQNPDWYVSKLTVEDTQHIDVVELEKERRSMSEDLFQQEFYTSFSMGIDGSFFAKYLDRARVAGRVGQVAWESAYKVHTAWDIGNDCTAIIFYQCIGQTIRLIDYYEKNNEGLEHYIKVIQQKPYVYGKHFFPHDMRVREWAGPRITRLDKARHLGLNGVMADELSIEDGIEAVKSNFDKMWIDEYNCKQLLKCIENYRQAFDVKTNRYSGIPIHDQFSHGCDALRYLCVSIGKTRDGLTPEELDKRYQSAYLGRNSNMPSVFRDDII